MQAEQRCKYNIVTRVSNTAIQLLVPRKRTRTPHACILSLCGYQKLTELTERKCCSLIPSTQSNAGLLLRNSGPAGWGAKHMIPSLRDSSASLGLSRERKPRKPGMHFLTEPLNRLPLAAEWPSWRWLFDAFQPHYFHNGCQTMRVSCCKTNHSGHPSQKGGHVFPKQLRQNAHGTSPVPAAVSHHMSTSLQIPSSRPPPRKIRRPRAVRRLAQSYQLLSGRLWFLTWVGLPSNPLLFNNHSVYTVSTPVLFFTCICFVCMCACGGRRASCGKCFSPSTTVSSGDWTGVVRLGHRHR